MGMKKENLLGMMAAMSNYGMGGRFIDTEEPPEEKEPIKKIIPKGLKPFDYGHGNIIYAINQKNADRKAKKLGLL